MIFRTITGELVEINRYDFINDKLYYEKIMEIKKYLRIEKIHDRNNNTFKIKNK